MTLSLSSKAFASVRKVLEEDVFPNSGRVSGTFVSGNASFRATWDRSRPFAWWKTAREMSEIDIPCSLRKAGTSFVKVEMASRNTRAPFIRIRGAPSQGSGSFQIRSARSPRLRVRTARSRKGGRLLRMWGVSDKRAAVPMSPKSMAVSGPWVGQSCADFFSALTTRMFLNDPEQRRDEPTARATKEPLQDPPMSMDGTARPEKIRPPTTGAVAGRRMPDDVDVSIRKSTVSSRSAPSAKRSRTAISARDSVPSPPAKVRVRIPVSFSSGKAGFPPFFPGRIDFFSRCLVQPIPQR